MKLSVITTKLLTDVLNSDGVSEIVNVGDDTIDFRWVNFMFVDTVSMDELALKSKEFLFSNMNEDLVIRRLLSSGQWVIKIEDVDYYANTECEAIFKACHRYL